MRLLAKKKTNGKTKVMRRYLMESRSLMEHLLWLRVRGAQWKPVTIVHGG